jgi:Fe-Mn family superoxide dismutase
MKSIYNIPKRYFSNLKNEIQLPKLDYDYGDLEPVISKENLELHHKKHHQTYINNYNILIKEFDGAMQKGETEKMVSLTQDIKFNGGSHINHSFFWKNLAPVKNGGGKLPEKSSGFLKHVEATWGSAENFMNDFMQNALNLQGSGYGWLAYVKNTKQLVFLATRDQDPLATLGSTYVPIFTVDMWEHTWYPTHKNDKKTFMKNIWKIVNWTEMEKRYEQAKTL